MPTPLPTGSSDEILTSRIMGWDCSLSPDAERVEARLARALADFVRRHDGAWPTWGQVLEMAKALGPQGR